MEKLTELRFEGTDRCQAWCETCKKWIDDVDMVFDCHPYNRDYAMCSTCHTGIVRSDKFDNT